MGGVVEGGRAGVAVLAAQQALGLSVGQAEEVPPVAGDDDVGSLAWSLPGGVAGVLSLAGTVCRAAVVLQQEGGGPAPGGQLEGGGGRGRREDAGGVDQRGHGLLPSVRLEFLLRRLF